MKIAEELLSQSPDPIWAIDAERKLGYFNPSYFELVRNFFGQEVRLGETVIPNDLGTDSETWKSRYNRAFSGESFEIEADFLDVESGLVHYYQIRFLPIYKDGEIIQVSCQARDVTRYVRRRKATNELLAKLKVSFVERNLEQAGYHFCKAIQEFGKFNLVELWVPNIEHSSIFRLAYQSISQAFNEENTTRDYFQKGEGLPGRTWEQEKQLLWGAEEIDHFFLRKHEAQLAGIQTLLGVPLRHDHTVSGVLIIGTSDGVEVLENFSGLIERLETLIGSEIFRKGLEEDLSNLYQAIPDILCVANFEGRFLRFNPAGYRLLGYSESEVLHETFESFVHPDDVQHTMDVFHDSIERDLSVFSLENRYITKAGEIIWLYWTCNTSKRDQTIYASAKDITKEKQLRELNRHANAMAKIGFWEIDLEKSEVYWSDMVHRIHGTRPDSFITTLESCACFYRSDFQPLVQHRLEKAINEGEVFDFEAVIIRTDGVERWVRSIGQVDFDGNKAVKVYGSFQDIHDSKSLELQITEILGSISDAFYNIDSEWKFTYFNKQAERLLGKKADEVIGKYIWELFPDIEETILNEKYLEVTATNQAQSFEFFYPGDNNWYEINAYPSKGGVSVYFKNINDRIHTAEALRQASIEKDKILESIGEAFFTVDENWRVSYWNRVAESLNGYNRSDVVGRKLWEVIDGVKETEFYKRLYLGRNQNRPVTFDDFYKPLNLWIEVTAYPTANGYSILIRDKSVRKKAEEKISQANERFVRATEATQDAIWDWDIENDVIYRSNNIVNFYGKDALSLLKFDEYWFEHFHCDDVEPFRISIANALSDPNCTRWEMEYRIYNEQGAMLYVIDRGVIVRDEDGKATRMVGAMTDLTSQKKLERELKELNASLNKYASELERSNEELEQFAFVTSHDLQEPLRMITSFMELLKRKYGDQLDERAHQYIHFASDGAKRMKQIILDLLEYSRAGRETGRLETVSITQVLSDYQLLRRKTIAETSAKIHYTDLPDVVTNKVSVTQIFHSLLDNSLKYARQGVAPEINVECRETSKEWTFYVRDNGIGIRPEFFSKIFLIFQRLHNRDEYSGTGIGLPLAKRHIEAMGGEMRVESTYGVGSTFSFTIPKPQFKLKNGNQTLESIAH